jgi:DNA-binding NarL/FixJ family response regulator
MFRVLQRMCRRIGVANRTEAIIWATKNGLL